MIKKIETSIRYTNDIGFRVGHFIFPGHLFRRRDYHEDGSHSDYYGIEIEKGSFKGLREMADPDGYIPVI